MTQTFGSISPQGRLYARSTARRSSLDAPAQRATQALARRDRQAREVTELARWEGEGGAVRPRSLIFKPAPMRLSMRVAMSGRPTYDAAARVDVEPMAAGLLAKPAPGFTGDRNAGPVKSRNARQNAPARPMNTRRGARSR